MFEQKEKSTNKTKIILGVLALVILAGVSIYASSSGLFQGYLKLNNSCQTQGSFGTVNLTNECSYLLEDVKLTISIQEFDRSAVSLKVTGAVANNFKLTAGGNPYVIKNKLNSLVSISYKGMDRAGNAVLLLENPSTVITKPTTGDCKDQETAGDEDITLCENTSVTHTVNGIEVKLNEIKDNKVELTFSSPADTLDDDFTLEMGQKLIYSQSPSTADLAARTGTVIIPQTITSDGKLIVRVESQTCDSNYSDVYDTPDFTSDLCINKQVFMSDRGGVQATVTGYNFNTEEVTLNVKIPDLSGSTHSLVTKIIPLNGYEDIVHDTPNGRYIHSFNNRGYVPENGLIKIQSGTVECLDQIAEDGEVFIGCIDNTLTYDAQGGDVVITRGPATNEWIDLEISNSNNPVFDEGEIRLLNGESVIVAPQSLIGSHQALSLTYEANNGLLMKEITCESELNAENGESYEQCVKTYLGSQTSGVNFQVNSFTGQSAELTANYNEANEEEVVLPKNTSIAVAKSKSELDFVGSKLTFFGDSKGKALIGHSEVNCPTVQIQSSSVSNSGICLNKWIKHDSSDFQIEFNGVVSRSAINATVSYPQNIGTETKQVQFVQNSPQTFNSRSTNGDAEIQVTFTGFNTQTGKAQFSLDVCNDQTAIDGQSSQVCFDNELTLDTSLGNITITPQAENTDGSINVWIDGAKDSRSGTGEVIKLSEGENLILASENLDDTNASYSTKSLKFENVQNAKAVFSTQSVQCLSYQGPGNTATLSESQRELCPQNSYRNSDNNMTAKVTKFSNGALSFLMGSNGREHTLSSGHAKAFGSLNSANQGTSYIYRGKNVQGKAKLELQTISCSNKSTSQSTEQVLCINRNITHTPSGIRVELIDSTQTTATVKIYYTDDNFDREQEFELFINNSESLDVLVGATAYRATLTFKGNDVTGLSILDFDVESL